MNIQEIVICALLIFVSLGALALLIFIGRKPDGMTKKQHKTMKRIFISSTLLLCLQLLGAEGISAIDAYTFVHLGRLLRLACHALVYLIIGYDILKKAFRGILGGRMLDEYFLMAIATLGAFAIAVYENGEYLEGIAVMLFYQIGEWFQGYAVGKSRKSISALMDIRPDYANVEIDGNLTRVSPDTLQIGSIITVLPGEKIPLDGVIISGTSSLNTSALTGESMPRDVAVGDEVMSGCINVSGVIRLKSTRPFDESTASKILELVENASSKKSISEKFISRFAKIYTPAVCISALALAFFPPIVSLIFSNPPLWGQWIYRALTFLIISCPCALVISIPLSFFAGIGGASREGILIKGSSYLETLSKAKYAVFDKTGTLTKGSFEVSEIITQDTSSDELIYYAAHAEGHSAHPIAKSIIAAYGGEIDRTKALDIKEKSGFGIECVVDGRKISVGNTRLMNALNISYTECESIGTKVYVAIDNVYVGCIVICDTVKSTSKNAIDTLKAVGIKRTVMLTGDSQAVAQKVAQELKIDEYHGDLLPADKLSIVEEMLADGEKNGKLVFVGDGINDAPVLMRADIGIAMGALGSDCAIESADVVLMDDNPEKIVKAIKISRKCMRIVYQNVILALSVKFLCLILGATGLGNMYLAIFADVGVMVIAVLNAIRCLYVKKI